MYPEQIGECLRSARKKAGFSIDDIVFKTQLPKTVVEALENENFSFFTSPVYAKSFLAQYSTFLNVEAAPWLDALKPSTFIEGGPLSSLLQNTYSTTGTSTARQPSSSNGFPVLLLSLIIAIGFLFGAFKFIQHYDLIFAAKVPTQKVIEILPVASKLPQEAVPQPLVKMETPAIPSSVEPATEPENPPSTAPRAIVVH
jgi:cytoskeletal protein RodZ